MVAMRNWEIAVELDSHRGSESAGWAEEASGRVSPVKSDVDNIKPS